MYQSCERKFSLRKKVFFSEKKDEKVHQEKLKFLHFSQLSAYDGGWFYKNYFGLGETDIILKQAASHHVPILRKKIFLDSEKKFFFQVKKCFSQSKKTKKFMKKS